MFKAEVIFRFFIPQVIILNTYSSYKLIKVESKIT